MSPRWKAALEGFPPWLKDDLASLSGDSGQRLSDHILELREMLDRQPDLDGLMPKHYYWDRTHLLERKRAPMDSERW